MAALTDCQLGLGVESTFGTYSAPTRFFEDAGAELDFEPNRVQGQGLRVGSRLARSGRRVTTTKSGGGSTPVELLTKSMGLLWESCLGSSTSTLVSGSTYQQNHVLTTSPIGLPSRTLQTGIVEAGGTADAISYLGCRVSKWKFSLGQGGIAMLEPEWDIRDVTTAQALATASYPTTPNLFHFAQASIAIGGAVTAPTSTALASGGTAVSNVLDFELEVDNKLNDKRHAIGGAGLKSAQVTTAPEAKGKMKVEYTDTVIRDAFLADTELALLLTFTSTEALSTGFATLQVVLPAIKLDGELPNSNQGDISEMSVEFTVLDNLTAAQPLYVVHRTSDTAL
jgi:hypothetical protein